MTAAKTVSAPEKHAIASVLATLMGIFGSLCLLGGAGVVIYMVYFHQTPAVVETDSAFWGRLIGLIVLAVIYLVQQFFQKALRDTLLLDGVWLLLSGFFGMFGLQMALKYGAAGFMDQPLLLFFLLTGCLFIILASLTGMLSSR